MRIIGVRKLMYNGKHVGYSVVTDEVYNTIKCSTKYDVSLRELDGYTIEYASGKVIKEENMHLSITGALLIGDLDDKYYVHNDVKKAVIMDLFRKDEGKKVKIMYCCVDVFDGLDLSKKREIKKDEVSCVCTTPSDSINKKNVYNNNYTIEETKSKELSIDDKKSIKDIINNISKYFSDLLSKYFKMVLSKQQDTTDEVNKLKEEISTLKSSIDDLIQSKQNVEVVEVVKDRVVEVPQIVKETVVVDNSKDYSEDIGVLNDGLSYVIDLLKDNSNSNISVKDSVEDIGVKDSVESSFNRRDGSHKELSVEFYKVLYKEWNNASISRTKLLKMFTDADGVYHHLLEGHKMSRGSMYNWYDYAEGLKCVDWDMSKFDEIRVEIDNIKKGKR